MAATALRARWLATSAAAPWPAARCLARPPAPAWGAARSLSAAKHAPAPPAAGTRRAAAARQRICALVLARRRVPLTPAIATEHEGFSRFRADAPLLAPRLLVVGVGGAGGNAVNNMIRAKLSGAVAWHSSWLQSVADPRRLTKGAPCCPELLGPAGLRR